MNFIVRLLGSQLGIIIFILAAFLILWVLAKSKKHVSENDSNSLIGCFAWIGFIVAAICMFLSKCADAHGDY